MVLYYYTTSAMSRSRNWIFKLRGDVEIERAIIIKKAKDNHLNHVTFLQLSKDNNVARGLVVLKNQVRHSVVMKMFAALDVELVNSLKEIMNSMGMIIFTYGKLLNKHEKRLASKASSYSQAVQHMAEKPLIPEHEVNFEIVYNIIASAETEAEGMLKIFEDLPLCKHLIIPAVKRFKLKKEQLGHMQRVAESQKIVWKKWQQELLIELEGFPDQRKVLWYFDPVGNTGKTFFAKWHNDLINNTAVVQSGRRHDILYILSKRTEDIKTVIMDLTRSGEDEVDYNVIESIKNGYFQSGKYDSRFVSIPTPHLVVFANFRPKTAQLSLDRWDIRSLIKNGDNIRIHRNNHIDFSQPAAHGNLNTCTRHHKLNCGHRLCMRKRRITKKHADITGDIDDSNTADDSESDDMMC